MAAIGLFLYGEDNIEDVRDLRNTAVRALASGRTVEWSDENVSIKKANGLNLDRVVEEANYFLRLYDPNVRKNNPYSKVSKPTILYP